MPKVNFVEQLRRPFYQHLIACAAAIGLSAVYRFLEPLGGVGGNILANILQKMLDKRETDPTLPDINHDLLRVIGNAVCAEIAEYGRDHAITLGSDRQQVNSLASFSKEGFVALFTENEVTGIDPPDALELLTQAQKEGALPPVGQLEDWKTIVSRLLSKGNVLLSPRVESEIATRLHTKALDSIRKALKNDFAADGKAYAALELQFMGKVLARLDSLDQSVKGLSATDPRELVEARREYKREHVDPKAELLIENVALGCDNRLEALIGNFAQISGKLDLRYNDILNQLAKVRGDIGAADRGSRFRDLITQKWLWWLVSSSALLALFGTIAFVYESAQKSQQIAAMDKKISEVIVLLGQDAAVKSLPDGSDLPSIAQVVERIRQTKGANQATANQVLDRLRVSGSIAELAAYLNKQLEQSPDNVALLRDLASVSYLGGENEAAVRFLRRIIALDPTDVHAMNALGEVYRRLGKHLEAKAQYAKMLTVAPDNKLACAAAYGNLGNLALEQGNVPEAETNYDRAYDLYVNLGALEGQATQLGNRGAIRALLGLADEAEKLSLQSLRIREDHGIEEGQQHNFGNLAQVAILRNALDVAETHARKSQAISSRLGDQSGRAMALFLIAQIERKTNRLNDAAQHCQEALDICERFGLVRELAKVKAEFGTLEMTRGNVAAAKALTNEALTINERIGNRIDQEQNQSQLINLAIVQSNSKGGISRSELQAAKELSTELVDLAKQRKNDAQRASHLNSLGIIEHKLRNLEAAEEALLTALAINTDLKRKTGLALNFLNLGNIANDRGDLKRARKWYDQSLELFKDLQNESGIALLQKLIAPLPPSENAPAVLSGGGGN